MFGLTNQSRGKLTNPLQELEQITSSLFGRTPKLDFELDVKDEGDAYVPVSYTHLDVYKRQEGGIAAHSLSHPG